MATSERLSPEELARRVAAYAATLSEDDRRAYLDRVHRTVREHEVNDMLRRMADAERRREMAPPS